MGAYPFPTLPISITHYRSMARSPRTLRCPTFFPVYRHPLTFFSALPEPITDLWVLFTFVPLQAFLTAHSASIRKPVFLRFRRRRLFHTCDTFLKISDFAQLERLSMLLRING